MRILTGWSTSLEPAKEKGSILPYSVILYHILGEKQLDLKRSYSKESVYLSWCVVHGKLRSVAGVRANWWGMEQ